MIDVAGAFLEHEGKVLVLHRRLHKIDGGTWALTGGKVDASETPLQALLREVKEEVGIELDPAHVRFLEMVPLADKYHFFTFFAQLDSKPPIVLRLEEHDAYQWCTVAELLALPELMPALRDLLGHLKAASQKPF